MFEESSLEGLVSRRVFEEGGGVGGKLKRRCKCLKVEYSKECCSCGKKEKTSQTLMEL